ncbi:MAG: nucleotidyl transferase AbiEii/AbiGii toxin family protein [Candidatus Eisenbacteria bacterium]|nr:nucleotidyl transferase AbiEii/AbiGii toxin family protein [Candidatus Eisenbacteria bacterium]
MKLKFLELTSADRGEYFTQAAQNRGVSPVIMEKDFWVSWMLAVLFQSRYAAHLVFKGGTSLSKVFGVIDRFSEDIDLGLCPSFLGLPDADTVPPTSRNRANVWMERAEAVCSEVVEQQVLPELHLAVSEAMGEERPWFEFVNDTTTESPVVLFNYPTTQPPGLSYLKRTVRLEFGSLTDQRPVGTHPILPWMADEVSDSFDDWHCDVVALELERTFWEKVTILHSEYHRPAEKPTPDRISRHYADTAALAGHPQGMAAARQGEVRDRVVEWKRLFFGSAWARYDLARPGSLKLLPNPTRRRALEVDYVKMRDMYLSTPLSFTRVMDALAGLEEVVNAE